jgi:hypothetical protein
MIEVLNAGSGATSASRDKFPRAILPRTFDYGFATALMVKECGSISTKPKRWACRPRSPRSIGRLWETAARDQDPDSDFTPVMKPFEKVARCHCGPGGRATVRPVQRTRDRPRR